MKGNGIFELKKMVDTRNHINFTRIDKNDLKDEILYFDNNEDSHFIKRNDYIYFLDSYFVSNEWGSGLLLEELEILDNEIFDLYEKFGDYKMVFEYLSL